MAKTKSMTWTKKARSKWTSHLPAMFQRTLRPKTMPKLKLIKLTVTANLRTQEPQKSIQQVMQRVNKLSLERKLLQATALKRTELAATTKWRQMSEMMK